MGSGQAGADNAARSRYECKYLVSREIAAEIRRFIQPFMVPDTYARHSVDHRYPLASLYLDTLDLQLYRQTATGEKNRFKLRVRSYADDPASPVFLEVKRRVNDVILKRRARLPRNAAAAVLAGTRVGAPDDGLKLVLQDLEFFAGHVQISDARPFLKVRYYREAYECLGGDPLRVTMDTDIAWIPSPDSNFDLGGEGWIRTPIPEVVLEIKFAERYPPWVREMIRSFGLQRQSVAKYALSVESFFGETRGRKLEMPARLVEPRNAMPTTPSIWNGTPVANFEVP